MARAMWRGAIQFGLVTIPVKLYLATESKGVSFNMLHKTDLSRIQMKIYCPVDDDVISRGDTVKGFEYAPGQYVVVTDEDLESVPLKTVRSIEIEQFTERAEVDDGAVKFVKQAYYLEPDAIGRKAFYLLKDVLEDKRLTAICKVVIKDREALAAIDPFAKTMLLTTLHWPDEIRSLAELDLPAEEPEIKAAERKMAEQLIEAMTGTFDPGRLPRRVPRGAAQDHRGEGRGRGDGCRARGRAGHQPRRPHGGARSERQGGRGRPWRRADIGQRRSVPEADGQGRGPREGRGPRDGGRARGGTAGPASQERLGRALAARAAPTACRSRSTSASATLRGRPSRPAPRPRRSQRRAGGSSSSATGPPGSTTTSGSRSAASSSAGPCRAVRRSIRAPGGWRSTWRTIRSSTSTSRASSRRSSTAPGT